MKVCAVAAQPGHTKELQSVQLERGLRIVDSPGAIFDDDDHIQGQESPDRGKHKRARSPGSRGSGPPSPVDPALNAEFNPDMVRAPKRLRRTSVRNISLPTAAVALRSRRAERLWRQKRKKVLRRAARG